MQISAVYTHIPPTDRHRTIHSWYIGEALPVYNNHDRVYKSMPDVILRVYRHNPLDTTGTNVCRLLVRSNKDFSRGNTRKPKCYSWWRVSETGRKWDYSAMTKQYVLWWKLLYQTTFSLNKSRFCYWNEIKENIT